MATKTKELLTEEKIRKHYQAEGGEWLVERGKTKEAALLKEACHELERLRKDQEGPKFLSLSNCTRYN